MRVHVAAGALLGVASSIAIARAGEIELKNDGFVSGGMAVAELGFAVGDIGAARYVAPAAGRQLTRVQLLFGGNSTATVPMTFKVWDDTAGTDAPGTELYSNDFTLTGSDMALSEISVAADNVIVPQQFRVGLVFQHAGAPSMMRDNDGTIAADKNYIYDKTVGWAKSNTFGVTGDWVIRAFVSDGGVSPPDAGTPDAFVGGACNGNADCPIGQFCDLSNHACTFECRSAADCAGGTCNSLGMCVAGGGGGGCCQTSGGGGGASILALGVLLAIHRRRR